MTYQKQEWRNLPSQETPISAERLNHLETQFDEAVAYTDAAIEANPGPPAPSGVEKVARIVVGWGQSNMSGRGLIAEGDTRYWPIPDRLLQFGFKERTLRAAEPILDHQDTATGIGPLYDFGLRLLGDSQPEDVVVLVPGARGGSPLVPDTGITWNPSASGGLYGLAVTQLQEALVEVAASYPGHRIVVEALLWHQGEGDNTLEPYMAVFRQLVTGFRGITGEITPVVIGQMQPKNITGTRYLVNQAHTLLARQDDFHSFAAMPRAASNDIGDGTHYSAIGQRVLAGSMWDAFKQARVNLQPRHNLQAPTTSPLITDQFDISGPITKDLLGNTWEVFGSSVSSAGQFISDGTFAKLDPSNAGLGRQFLLSDACYSRRISVLTQWGSASVRSYRMILAWANMEDYLFIDVSGANFRLGRWRDGTTSYLGSSATASTNAETVFSIGSTTVNGTVAGVALGGDFPVTIPSDFEGGTRFGVSMQATDAGNSLLNRISISTLDSLPM